MKKIRYYENMTEEMQKVVDYTMDQERLKEEFIKCNEMYEKSKKAGEIRLPCKAASGQPVLHGARMEVKEITDYWEIRRDAIKQFLPDEWVEEQGVSARSYKI